MAKKLTSENSVMNLCSSSLPTDDSSTASNVLHVMMHETESAQFGFILNKNGIIESACGNSDEVLGVSKSYLKNQYIVRFVALPDRQKICSILPSGNYNLGAKRLSSKISAPRKTVSCEFLCQRTGKKTKLEVTASLIVTTMTENSTNLAERSCSHVVCVTHRPSSDSECGGIKAESLSKPPCIVLVLGGDRRVQHVEFRERLDGIDEKDFLSKCIFELCPRSDRPVLETLLDSVTQCSAELKICVNNRNLNINATSARQSGSEQIRLECKLVDRTSHHSVEQQSNLSVYPFEAISPASSTSRDVPHDMMGSPTMCTSVLSDSFETKPSNLTENKFRQQPLTIPHQEQPSYNFSYFTKPDSSSFDFGDKEESPSAKKKRRPSKVKIKPMNEENNGISKNTSLFSPTTIETPKPKNTMLQTLLTSNAPCISFNINQIPNMSSPQYFSNPVSRQAYMVENQVGATKQKATKTSRAKRKELANSTAAATTPTSTSTTAIGFAVGSSIPHQNLPANMFQTSMASVQMGGGMAAYVMTGPGPMPNGAQMNGGVVYNPHNMPIASTSSGGCNQPISQAGSSGFSVASTPLQLQNHQPGQNMSSSSYAHMNHNMNAMAQGMVNCNPMGNVAATNMHPMAAASMNGVNNSMSPQMMNPQWAQNPNSIEFQSGGYSNQLGQNYPMLHSQQNSSQNGMLGSPNSNNLTAQKKNILKRKNMMQPQPNQQFIMDQQQPPNKQPFMTSNHPEMIQNHYIQQNPSSMYQMGQQQNGAVQGSSPQFSSASPMNNHNHLSPYGGYDSANGVQPQWNKRPPSRGDIVRMELRHSVQARRATSPHPPNGMISANDLGMPRFPAPTNAISPSNMMLSPQRISQPSQDAQQTQQQQQQQQHSNQALRADSVYSGQILNAIPQNFPSESQKNFHLQQDMNNPMTQLSQFSSSTINTLPPISLEDCRAILECDFNDLCNDLGPPDFNLCNGQFDMDYDETRNLVQRILG